MTHKISVPNQKSGARDDSACNNRRLVRLFLKVEALPAVDGWLARPNSNACLEKGVNPWNLFDEPLLTVARP